MKTFYSILYVPIRPEVSERLTVGLLFQSNTKVYFHYSKEKMEVLKHLLPKQAYNLLRLSLMNIERAVLKAKKDTEESLKELFPSENIVSNVISESYIEYLSRYNKNLLAFTSPQYTDIEFNYSNFKILYNKLIAEDEFVSEKIKEPVDIIKQTHASLRPKIEKFVNWDFKVTDKHFKNLILPSIDVDFIGKNGRYISGQTIDFIKPEYVLDNTIAKQLALISAMHEENKQSKCFILGKEPDKKYKSQYKLWHNISYSEIFDFIDVDETEKVVTYLKQNEVHPLEIINE